MKKLQISKMRFGLVFGILFCLWAVLELRMFQIQVLHRDNLASLAESQGRRMKAIEARRGTLVDRHGLPLACSVANRAEMDRTLESGTRLYRRIFPLGDLAGRVIGLVDYRGLGLEGIEARFDAVLRGSDGRIVLPVVGTGHISPYEPAVIRESPHAGQDLRLTMDAVYQGLALREARLLKDHTGSIWTGILIIRPTTGEILAAAVAPAYDPEEPTPSGSSANLLWSRSFEPGSSFKIITAAAALEHGLITPHTMIDCENGVWASNGRHWHDTHSIGSVTFGDAFAHSSNIAAAKIGLEIGSERFYHMARAFGFGQPTSVDLPAETSGRLRIATRPVSLSAMSMGHELTVTAVQLLNAYCCIGSNGRLMQPRLVTKLSEQEEQSSIIIRQAILPETAVTVTDLLTGVVDHGTGRKASHPLVIIAGKTGTAQKADPGGKGYRPGAYISTFVGFFPAHRPLIAMLIIADEPQGDYYAGDVCAPVFKTMVDHLLTASGGGLYPELAARLSKTPFSDSKVEMRRPDHAPQA